MILSLIAILIVLLLAFVGASKGGFFSSLINLVCVLVAGAIAFAAWEPLGYALINAAPQDGFLTIVADTGWGLALALPFALSLAALRGLVDTFLGANVSVSQAANYAGGGICALLSAIITTGIIILSLGFFRTFPFSYQPLQYSSDGSLTRQESLILPVDKWVANFYGGLSERAFRVPQPLARWHPNFYEAGPTMAITFNQKARNTVKPADFEVLARLTIGGPNASLDDLLRDAASPAPQKISNPDGEPFAAASRLEGFAVRFNASAGESSGKVMLGAGQVRLVVENPQTFERRTVFPIAVSSQAEAQTPIFGRWRYDSADFFVSSVGGAAESYFMFEFPVEPGFEPIALYIRGSRAAIDPAAPPKATLTRAQRDGLVPVLGQAIRSGNFSAGAAVAASGGAINASQATRVEVPANQFPEGVQPGRAIGSTFQKGLHAPIEIDGDNNVIAGEKTWGRDEVRAMQSSPLERPLRIQSFAVEEDTDLFKIDVTRPGPFSFLNPVIQSAERSERIALVDTNGQAYVPIGLLYFDDIVYTLRYTPSAPLTSLEAIDEYGRISRSRSDQNLTLVFRVSKGVSIQYMVVGDKAVVRFDPPLEVRR